MSMLRFENPNTTGFHFNSLVFQGSTYWVLNIRKYWYGRLWRSLTFVFVYHGLSLAAQILQTTKHKMNISSKYSTPQKWGSTTRLQLIKFRTFSFTRKYLSSRPSNRHPILYVSKYNQFMIQFDHLLLSLASTLLILNTSKLYCTRFPTSIFGVPFEISH